MKVLKIIAIAIVIIFFLLVIGGFLLPSGWAVTESITVEASAEEVYPLVSNFREWPHWTAWAAADPAMTYEYAGPAAGVGQVTVWSGNQGTGRMEITALDSLRQVEYYFSMDEGRFGAASTLRLEDVSNGTRITWSSSGDVGSNIAARYFMKVFAPYMSADYRAGLERLKGVMEG